MILPSMSILSGPTALLLVVADSPHVTGNELIWVLMTRNSGMLVKVCGYS